VSGLLRDLNERAAKANHPTLVITRTVTETLPNGRNTEKRVLSMSDEVASLVRNAERAELADAPTPVSERSS
jgi:hypothetical protein